MQIKTANQIKLTSLNRFSQLKYQLGVTLIESMVAMVVFSVGALGLAAMQLATMTQSDEVKKNTLVSFKVQGLIERMQTSVTSLDTDGLYAEYAIAIQALPGNNGSTTFSGSGIGVDDGNAVLTCTGTAPTACAAAGSCSNAQLVTLDVWEVFCDADTGLAATGVEQEEVATGTLLNTNNRSGVVGLGNAQVQVLMVADAVAGNRIYVETVSRSADNNVDFAAETVTTNLCGDEVADIEATLDIYCIKF